MIPRNGITKEDNLTDKKIAELRKKSFKATMNVCFDVIKDLTLLQVMLFVVARVWMGIPADGMFEEYVRYMVLGGSLLILVLWIVELGARYTEKRNTKYFGA